MQEESAVATFLNEHLFDTIARSLGKQIAPGHHALPDHIVMILLVAFGLVIFSAWLRTQLSVDSPTRMQHIMEALLGIVQGLMKDVITGDTRPFLPLIGTLAIYILVCNLIGMIPGFVAPTSSLNITASCGICVFFYYNYHGVRKHGVLKYLKHFCGPVWVLAVLLLPIEIVSHMARPLSLSMRLFGNIFSEELIIGSLNQIFPFFASVIVMFLGLLTSTIQAFIFILLTMVYLSGAVEEAHEGGHAEEEHEEHTAHSNTQAAAA
jgi:F-type H+-transporting ATPase subunit a